MTAKLIPSKQTKPKKLMSQPLVALPIILGLLDTNMIIKIKIGAVIP